MDRRVVILAVGLAFVGTVVGAALLFERVPRVVLSDEPTAADSITLYQSGLVFASLHRTFEAQGGDALLVLSVPSTTVFDSIAVAGGDVTVRQLRASAALDPVIAPGDEVVVHVGERTYSGTVVSFEGADLLLEAPDGVLLVDAAKAEAIEVRGAEPRGSGAGAAEVLVLVDAPAGTHNVTVSYLANGPGWTPSHRLETTTGQFTFFATLEGLFDWRNVTLDLVAGQPNVVATPRLPTPSPVFDERAAAGAGAATPAFDVGFQPSTPLGELHRYRYDQKVDLAKGESVRLAVAEGTVAIVRHYFNAESSSGFGGATGERRDVQVRERYELRNELSEPLPPGIVRLYQDGTWFAEDNLEALPVGDRTNVTASLAQEVEAFVVLESLQSEPDRDVYRYALTVDNRKQEGTVDVRAALSYPTFRTNVLSTTPQPDRLVGGEAIWNTELAAAEGASFRISYEQLRNR